MTICFYSVFQFAIHLLQLYHNQYNAWTPQYIWTIIRDTVTSTYNFFTAHNGDAVVCSSQ